MEKEKKLIYSAIQPSGMLTLGNYLGALRNWVKLQEEYDRIYTVALISRCHYCKGSRRPLSESKFLKPMLCLSRWASIPKKACCLYSLMFAAHSQLSWILSCYTQFGELSRMTQFKDKFGQARRQC